MDTVEKEYARGRSRINETDSRHGGEYSRRQSMPLTPTVDENYQHEHHGRLGIEDEFKRAEEIVYNHNFEGKMHDASSMVSRLANEIISLRRDNVTLKGELHHVRDTLGGELAKHAEESLDLRANLHALEDEARNKELERQEREREWERQDRDLRSDFDAKKHHWEMEHTRSMAEKDTELHRITRELELSQTKLGNAMKDVEANEEALKAYQADVEMKLEIMASKMSTETSEDRKSLTEKVQMRALITTLQSEVESSRAELTQERAKGHALEVQTRKLLDDRRAAVAEEELEKQISDLREDKAGLQKDKDSYLAVVTAMREEKERLEQNQVLLMRRESMLTVRLEENQKATVKSQNDTTALDGLKVKLQETTKLGSSYKARFEAAENKVVALTKMNQDLHEELQLNTALLEKMNVRVHEHDDD